jgi:RNA polymerase sigma factor (sigma-70 family)
MNTWKELLEGIRHDETLFRELYDRTVDRLFSYVLVRVRNRDDAKEIVQEIYLSLFSSLPKFVYISDEHFMSYFWTIARRRIFKRRLRKIQTVPLEEIYDIASEETPGEDYRFLFRSLRRLKEKEKIVIQLRYFSHYSFKEISESCNITENNAKVIHHRALEKLKQHLQTYVL